MWQKYAAGGEGERGPICPLAGGARRRSTFASAGSQNAAHEHAYTCACARTPAYLPVCMLPQHAAAFEAAALAHLPDEDVELPTESAGGGVKSEGVSSSPREFVASRLLLLRSAWADDIKMHADSQARVRVVGWGAACAWGRVGRLECSQVGSQFG